MEFRTNYTKTQHVCYTPATHSHTESIPSICNLRSKASFYVLEAQLRRLSSFLPEMCQRECENYVILTTKFLLLRKNRSFVA